MSDATPLNEFLSERDRVLLAAWMLPNEGALTDFQRKQAMENFSAYLLRNRLKFTDVALQIGRPRWTTILDLTKGVYRKNADEHIRKLNFWIEQHARSKAAKIDEEFVEIRLAKEIFAVADLVRENQTMGLILGCTGLGKSMCAEALSRTVVGSILIRVMNNYTRPKGLISAIALRLGVRYRRHARGASQETMMERVVNTLRKSGRFLLVDEAQQLDEGAIEVLRDIHDTTSIPILIFATKDLHDRILQTRTPDLGQLYSRIDVVHDLCRGKDVYSGGKPVVTLDDIVKLYHRGMVKLSNDAKHYLFDLANKLGDGSLRRCKLLVMNAVRIARKRQGLGPEDVVTIVAEDLAYVELRFRQADAEQEIMADRRRGAAATA